MQEKAPSSWSLDRVLIYPAVPSDPQPIHSSLLTIPDAPSPFQPPCLCPQGFSHKCPWQYLRGTSLVYTGKIISSWHFLCPASRS